MYFFQKIKPGKSCSFRGGAEVYYFLLSSPSEYNLLSNCLTSIVIRVDGISFPHCESLNKM